MTLAIGCSCAVGIAGRPCPIHGAVVGHKTFHDGHHEPLRESEAAALMKASDDDKARRAEQMPDETAAIHAFFEAWLRLKELGWDDAIYCPKDGSEFAAIEPGSTGIHRCYYEGQWPSGRWWIRGDDDLYPSRPVLFKAEKDRTMNEVVVIVNGRKFTVEQRDLSYADVVGFAGYKPERVLSVVVSLKGHEGRTLAQGGHIWPVEGMVINVADTSNA